MDPVLGGAIVAGGSSLVSGIVGGLGQAQANKRGVKLAREQMKWNESMWNKQNAYNLPSAQIQRMKDAGLNPALMYSQGNVGNAGEVKGYQLPSVQNELAPLAQGIQSAGSSVFDAFIKNEQVKQMQAQTQLLQNKAVQVQNMTPTAKAWSEWFANKTKGVFASAEMQHALAVINQARARYANSFYDSQAQRAEELLKQEIVNTIVAEHTGPKQISRFNLQNQLFEKQAEYLIKRYDVLDQMTPLELQKLLAQIKKIDADRDFVRWQMKDGVNGKTILQTVGNLFNSFMKVKLGRRPINRF